MSDYFANQENENIDELGEENSPSEGSVGKNKKLFIIIAAVVAVVAIAALVLVLILGGGKSGNDGAGDDDSSKEEGSSEEEGKGVVEVTCEYTVNPDGKTCTITGVVSPSGAKKIRFPSEIDGYAVTKIGSGELIEYENDNGYYAALFGLEYEYVSGIDEVEIIVVPEGVVEIADGAFSRSYMVKKILLPDGLTTIGQNAICYSATFLTQLDIPSSVASFGRQLLFDYSLASNFKYNEYGGSRYLGNKDNPYIILMGIDEGADSNVIHADTKIIYNNPSGSKNILVDEGNQSYISIDGNLYTKDGKTLLQYATGNPRPSFVVPQGVTAIGDNAFSGSQYLENVAILEATTIGKQAFSSCKSLAQVTMADSVLTIDESAFSECKALETIRFSTNLTSIGEGAFSNCAALESITLPSEITAISESAFAGCITLKNVVIPEGVTEIGSDAFSGCTLLENPILPSSLETIGDFAFERCRSITEIVIPDSVSEIGKYAFNSCETLKNVKLSSGLTKLSEGAFSSCGFLQEIEIPRSITHIESDAFASSYLSRIELHDNITNLDPRAFTRCNHLVDIQVDSGNPIYKAQGGNVYSKDGKTLVIYAPGKVDVSVTVPDDVTVIGDYAFYNNRKLREVELPYGIESISGSAFFGSSLTKINLPESLISIGEEAFVSCDFESIDLPDSLVSIGNGAFANSSIKWINLPDTVSSLGTGAFSKCKNLKNIVIPDSICEIPGDLLDGCESLESVELHSKITKIGSCAFNGCRSLTGITIPESVTYIGGGAFSNCLSLTEIYIPAGVETLEYGLFRINDFDGSFSSSNTNAMFCNCPSLARIEVAPGNPNYKSIDGNLYTKDGKTLIQYAIGKTETSFKLPEGVEKIGYNAFSLSPSLVHIELSEGVTTIERQAFERCEKLESLVIPKSVTTIESLGDVETITDIYYSGSRLAWEKIVGRETLDSDMNITFHYNYKQ